MDNWDLHNSFNLLRYLSNHFNGHFDLFNDFFNSVLNDYFLNNSFHFNNFLHYPFNSDNFFNDLGYFNYSFNCLDNWNRFLDDSVNGFISNLYMVIDLLGNNHLLLRDKDLS